MTKERVLIVVLTALTLGFGLACAYIGISQNQSVLAGIGGLLFVSGFYFYYSFTRE